MRVPFLRVGWNRQFLMMKEFGFVYDSSMTAPFSDPPLWPYTLDHKMPHKCTGDHIIGLLMKLIRLEHITIGQIIKYYYGLAYKSSIVTFISATCNFKEREVSTEIYK